MKPADLGFYAVSRQRYYFLLVHKRKGVFIQDPCILYDKIKQHFDGQTAVLIKDLFWQTNEEELKAERLASCVGKRLSSGDSSWAGLLTSWESKNLETYTKNWLDAHGNSLEDAVFVLSQNSSTSHATESNKPPDAPGTMPTVCLGVQCSLSFAPFSSS